MGEDTPGADGVKSWVYVYEVDHDEDVTWCARCESPNGVLATSIGFRLACTNCGWWVPLRILPSHEVLLHARRVGGRPYTATAKR